ncbi:DNA ligase 4-like protein [Phanerochaete sordida]|uniref:DNA ligase 4-like protein n=1 Tax=Phanerochaete sordida TaxID=48140 RepID=A0A9P3GA43_9APHY|nr:DNA ligase 4-like protein [Phanerochaete sordida]
MTDSSSPREIPFDFFVSLCKAFADAAPKRATLTKNQPKNQVSHYVRTLTNWVQHLQEKHASLPDGTAATLLLFLFPEEDVSRKYGMQETRLAGYVADILGVSTDRDSRGASLRRWDEAGTAGCLGQEVRLLMECASSNEAETRCLNDISTLLTELASSSAYSSSSVRAPPASRRKPREILRDLYAPASPLSAAIITQIILKDLRPILYPLKETHYRAQLLEYNSKAVCMLTKEQAMKVWDPTGKLSQAARMCASIEEAVAAYEHPEGLLQPKIGVPVPIPKCIKGKGCKDSLNVLKEASKVWIETKYDGERAQIHVEVDDTGRSKITIFSKSKRDSTMDRYATHSIIRDALGLPDPFEGGGDSTITPRIKRNVIIEAEMVAYSDTTRKVDEFWRIRSLIASTAIGVRGASYKKAQPHDDCSQSSLLSNASDDGARRLALVFFDVLLVDDECLLYAPYWRRRARLEALIVPRPGYAMLAERVPVVMQSREEANLALREVFARLQGEREEGAVLKADESRYNDWKLRWVKLKADYIPGYGDCLDLVVLGAGWEKDRARELLVSPEVYTTFYIGALSNVAVIEADPTTRPNFQIVFTCSYGLDRKQLEEFNFLAKNSDPVNYSAATSKHMSLLPYSFKLNPGLAPPSVMLPQPILAEFYGGGFTKAPRSKYYELRWPRMTKFYRASERSWRDGNSLEEFQRIAREAVGRDRPHKDVDDFCKGLWGKVQSPSVHHPEKRKEREEDWLEKLERADGKIKLKARKLDFHATADRSRAEKHEMPAPAATPQKQKMRAFGSVTNVLPTPLVSADKGRPNEVLLPTPKPTAGRPRRTIAASNRENSAKIPSIMATVAQEQAQTPEAHANPTPATSNSDVFAPPTPPSSNPGLSPASVDQSFPTGPCTLRAFLQHAAVYLARDTRLRRPRWRAPSSTVVPFGHQLNTIDALLIACAWDSAHEVEWAKFGVVFVDDSDTTYAWMDVVSRPLLEKRATLVHAGRPLGKPIFILGLSMMHVDRLEEEVPVLERAICRFG